MKSWSLKDTPELLPHPIDPKHYQKLLAEVSALLVKMRSQLRPTDIDVTPISNGSCTSTLTQAPDKQGASKRKAAS